MLHTLRDFHSSTVPDLGDYFHPYPKDTASSQSGGISDWNPLFSPDITFVWTGLRGKERTSKTDSPNPNIGEVG